MLYFLIIYLLFLPPPSTEGAVGKGSIKEYDNIGPSYTRKGGIGEYKDNKDSGSVVHMRLSRSLPEATSEIDFGDGKGNDDDEENHQHHSNRVSIVECAAAASGTLTLPWRRPHGQRGRSRPRPGGCCDENFGIGIVIGQK